MGCGSNWIWINFVWYAHWLNLSYMSQTLINEIRLLRHSYISQHKCFSEVALIWQVMSHDTLLTRLVSNCLLTIKIPSESSLFLGGPSDLHLLKVLLVFAPRDVCNQAYKNDESLPNGINEATQLCVGDSEGIRDTCQVSSKIESKLILVPLVNQLMSQPFCRVTAVALYNVLKLKIMKNDTLYWA